MGMDGKVALVTGATRGIGKAIAESFLTNGAKVAILGRNESLLREMAHPNALPLQGDVSDSGQIDTALEAILQKWGRIDVVVNNAGITQDNLLMRMSDQDWQKVIDTNLTGVFNVCRAAIRPMMKQRSGNIINVSSVIGVTGNAGQANYAASKAGVIGFSKSLAKEVASRGILVNVVAPGYIDTDMTGKLSEKQRQQILHAIPLGRTGRVEDVAEVVMFLASNQNAYITGQTIHVDGGLVI